MSPDADRKLWKKLKVEEFPQPEYIHLQYPVLLCHGFGSLASLFKKSPMDDICMMYRSHGIPAFAPNIVPYQTIQVRAGDWCDVIKTICEQTGSLKVNVIAHSMGGLDIRYAISRLDMDKMVSSLTTISTPHYGSSLSDWVLKAPARVKTVMSALFNNFGNRVYPQIESDALAAIKQLTPAYITDEFNPTTPDVEEIRYYSYSASCGKDTDTSINTLLLPFNRHIYEVEGLNDGFVSEKSAHWGSFVSSVNLSHLDLIHLNIAKDREETWREFWTNVAYNLRDNGF